ncbi:MAG: ZIP family metal transporter [Bacillales bacterium]|jgi:ZIP family zinc transporter|nr:ZIP family metal transporter [Bacillales bacterium]
MNPVLLAFLGTLIAFFGTTLGASFIFFFRKGLNDTLNRIFLGFASGVMLAASFFSLILPSMQYSEQQEMPVWLPLLIGFLLGALFLFVLDKVIPHQHLNNEKPEGPKSNLSKQLKLFIAVTLHNIPEGMAVGLAFAISGPDNPVSLIGAFALAIGIAIQNIPEGAIISLPLQSEGLSKPKAFIFGMLSGIVEPIAGVLTALLAYFLFPVVPFVLTFAAGAMVYVVVDELIPDASQEHSNVGVVSAILGFALMMLLDTLL